jgi:hypothetical protein
MLTLATTREYGVGWWSDAATTSEPLALMNSGAPETKLDHQQGEYSS